jgi:hypothetical protein
VRVRVNLGVSGIILSKSKNTYNYSDVLVILEELPTKGLGMSSEVTGLSSNVNLKASVFDNGNANFTTLGHLKEVSSLRWSPASPEFVHEVCKKSVNGRKSHVRECIGQDVIDIDQIEFHSPSSANVVDELDGGVGNVLHFVVSQMH